MGSAMSADPSTRGGASSRGESAAAQPHYYEAIIKVNPTDDAGRRKRDIIDGLAYACALLLDEYELSADDIAGVLERVTDNINDQEAQRDY
jgi:hypothetical protein